MRIQSVRIEGTMGSVDAGALAPGRWLQQLKGDLEDVDRLARQQRTGRGQLLVGVVSLDLVVKAVKVPIGSTLLEPALARVGPMDPVTVVDDVLKAEATGPETTSPAAVVVHAIGLAEVVP